MTDVEPKPYDIPGATRPGVTIRVHKERCTPPPRPRTYTCTAGDSTRGPAGRFGFDDLEHVATKNGCTIGVANQESLSPQEEMVQDVLAIVRTFSCRLYGLRRYEKTLKDELAGGGR